MKFKFIFLFMVICIVAALLLRIVFIKICSPGKLDFIYDSEGKIIEDSISEKVYVDINGVKQGMIIRSSNINNPVLLFVHGGPMMPEYFLDCSKYSPELERYFTICWWEQPGVGMSYSENLSASDLTVDAIVSDTIGVSNYLRERFNKDKIYLLGHSWGSFIGIQAAYKEPDLYNAYIGVGQITNQKESEKKSYEYMIEKYSEVQNKSKINKLKSYSINDSDEELLRYFKSPLRDEAMHELGIGTKHNMKSVISGIFIPVMKCRAYTLTEKMNIWKGKSYIRNKTDLIEKDLFADIPTMIDELKVPCYFISGAYDYTVSREQVEEYYNEIKAPKKGFYLFENSAHSPMFEENKRFYDVMKEIAEQ